MKNPHRALRLKDKHTFQQIYWRLCRVLEREKLIDEYFSLQDATWTFCEPWFPYMRKRGLTWFACYVVTGGSEGHYIHIDAASKYSLPDCTGTTLHLITGKTFLGMKHAQKIAARCAELLGA